MIRNRLELGVWIVVLLAACAQPREDRSNSTGSAGMQASAGASGSVAGSPPPSSGSGGLLASAGSGGQSIAGAGASAIAGSGGRAGASQAGGAGGGGSGGTGGSGGASGAGAGGSQGQGGAGSGGSSAPDDRCDVAIYDPSDPPQALDVSGNLGTHDPTLIEQNGVFYLHQTGPRLPGKVSTDLRRWDAQPSAFGNSNPGWIGSEVPQATDLWAPDLSYFGGQYHLYYSASSFGSNFSCIGHATRASLESGSWSDHGSVVCSNHDSNDDWNSIDPNAIVDEDGTAWLVFGSFWDGIKAIELDQDGARANDDLHSIASRGGGAIEAPYVVRRCGYYYLFVSFDRCCNGASSTYNIRVGRSEQVLGPYVDREGRAMLDGGGSLLVQGGGAWRGPGHNAVIFSGERAYNVFHAYSASNGSSSLRVAELAWDEDGWPISGGP